MKIRLREKARSRVPMVLLLIGVAPPIAAQDGPGLTAERVAAFFDAAFDVQRQDHGVVGAVVSVVHDGEVLVRRGYGWADLEAREPVDPDRTLFRIASISKTFVWTALMQLVEEGRIDLDADVNRYLDFPIPEAFGEPVRVWHLMTHTAGFEEGWIGWAARVPDDVRPLGEALADLMPARVWPPGRYAAYSNYGAALAGYIVQRVTGRPWHDVVEEQILEPLAMMSTNARTELPPGLRERLARGYAWSNGRFVATPYSYMHLEPAGNMSSTASDMARFMLAHLNGGTLGGRRILEERTARLMHSPRFAPHPELPPLLHGFYRSDRNGLVAFGHGGDVNQFHSQMRLLPEVGVGVFVSFNSDPGAAARSGLVDAFIDHFFPGEHLPAAPDPADVDLREYRGRYVPLRGNFTTLERLRTVFRGGGVGLSTGEGGGLRVGNGMELVPTGPDRFTLRHGELPVVFQRNEEGDVTHMLAGSPLSSFERVDGLDDPGMVRRLFLATLLVCLVAVVAWAYGAARPFALGDGLPGHHILVAWIHSAAVVALLACLPAMFDGRLAYGMTPGFRVLLLALNANLGLGVLVLGFTVEQWLRGRGTLSGRLGYTVVALASLFNAWLVVSFGLLRSPLRLGLPL